jgi:hypothetical protein
MTKFWVIPASILIRIAIAFGLLGIVVSRFLQDTFYPQAPRMPAAVRETTEKLLARYEQILQKRAPKVLAATQPGLTDAQIDALEKEHRLTLPPDLRAVYRWPHR